jgi:predicted RNA-binding Zn-ribbon protein involved in translation (DUF1610 family)
MSFFREKLTYFNGKVVCPRCDGNGLIYRATLMPINKTIYICDECEAMWPDTIISKHNFQDFTSYIAALGYTYNEVEISDIDYYWHQVKT